ncbi:hypothetical protein Q5752_001703 [Cryptotrichosporon argae]
MVSKLINLLPILALLGLALEGVPVAAASHTVQRNQARHARAAEHVKAVHRRNEHERAARRLAKAIGKQERKRKDSGKLVRRTDGTTCRARTSASTSSYAAPSTSSSASAYVASTTTSSYVYVAPLSSSVDYATSSSDSWSSSNNWYNDAAAATSSASAAATSSAAAAATSASVSVGTSSGASINTGSKFGAAWPNGDYASSSDASYIGNYVGSKTSWYYTWSPINVASGDSIGLEFVPMLWGPTQVSEWYSYQSQWGSNVKNALFFNEPNESSQCNMAAADSVSYWMNDYLPIRSSNGIALGGAATTSAPSGLEWILAFSAACTADGNSASDCAMDFIPLHYYDVTASGFQSYVENFYSSTNTELWITEYACENYNGGAQCTSDETWSFHETMAAWFDDQDYVTRYAPFGMMEDMQGVNQDNALMNTDGSITSLGSWYIASA